jgi:hypothetical protein
VRRLDRGALTLALRMERDRSPDDARRTAEALAKGEAWEDLAKSAAYALQCASLRLKPWEAPPCHTRGEIPDPALYGSRPGEIKLRERMKRAGVSVWHPDPRTALAGAEGAAALRHSRDGAR